jgi:ketosteroid isomerase-like protein
LQRLCYGVAERLTKDEQEISKVFEDGDCALIACDVAELSRIYADDYIQYDDSGNASTKSDVIDRLASGAIRFISMVSTGRRIRLLRGDVAIVHGSEDDVVERGGKRVPVRYLYMDVVVKRDGRWQIVGSQLARPLGDSNGPLLE